jgi:hypothetical protein
MIDLDLAEYAKRRGRKYDAQKHESLFKQKRIKTIMETRTGLDDVVRKLRENTWKQAEHHDKQIAHFLAKDRFQEQSTRQAEHDRLVGDSMVHPNMQPYVNARIDNLKKLLSNK